MNQRIRELAKLAEQYANQQNELYGVDFKTEYDQKFAELIVKECAGVAEVSMPIDSHPDDRLTVKNSVLKHFGVEE